MLSNPSSASILTKTWAGKTLLSAKVETTSAANLYLVAAGKTFYIVQLGLAIHSSVDGASGYIDTSLANLPEFLRIYSAITPTYHTKDKGSVAIAYPHPVPMVGSIALHIHSSDANLTATGHVIGWEE